MSLVFWYNFVDSGIVLCIIFTNSWRWWLVVRWYFYNIHEIFIKKFYKLFASLLCFHLFSILLQSFVMQFLFVKKSFVVLEKVLFNIAPPCVASLNNFLLAFQVNEIHLLLPFLVNYNIFLRRLFYITGFSLGLVHNCVS